MNTFRLILGPALLAVSFATSLPAASSATQTVTFVVSAINELTVTSNPGTLTISAAAPGSEPDAVSDSSSSYAITTNETNRKITVAIDAAMPSGVTLTASLVAPTGASSAGTVTLGTVAADAVTGITRARQSGRTITYGLSATAAAGTQSSSSRTVTLTVTAG